MCGRFTITLTPDDLQAEFNLASVPQDLQPRFNIAPSQMVGVITDAQKRNLEIMKWGLVPSWARDVSIGNKMINARSETLAEKPSFRRALERRRCLIPSDGFFEWMRKGRKGTPATPFYFQLVDKKPFMFAGLWEFWKSPTTEPLLTFTVITTHANDLVAPIHERMPVILDRDHCWDWLKPQPQPDLLAMLLPFPAERMRVHPVSRKVNDPANDVRACILPLDEED